MIDTKSRERSEVFSSLNTVLVINGLENQVPVDTALCANENVSLPHERVYLGCGRGAQSIGVGTRQR